MKYIISAASKVPHSIVNAVSKVRKYHGLPLPAMTKNATCFTPQSSALQLHLKYRADIDGLRAVAVLSVLCFHAFPESVRGGFAGVDVFFVISGYLISSIIFGGLDKGTFSLTEFYSRRIKRIFPALFLVLAACYAFGWFALFPEEYKQLGKHIAGGAAFISNFVLWNESGYFDNSADTKPLLHLWSLGIEEQFYIIWPVLLYFAWKRQLNLTLVLLAALGLSFLLNIRLIGRDSIGTFYSPSTRAWELLAGSILAYLSAYRQNAFAKAHAGIGGIFHGLIYRTSYTLDRETLRNTRSIIGFLLIAGAVFALNKQKLFPGWWAVLPTLGAFLVISAGPNAWLNRKVLAHPVLVWFGLISFPLYLWHWPLLSFARIIESTTPPAHVRGIAIILSIGLAWVTYRLIERPIRFGMHSKAKAFTLFALMFIIGYIGYNTYVRNGLGFRSTIEPFYENKSQLSRTSEADDQCKSFVGNDRPLFPYCRYNNIGGTETVALIGDSHAHVTFPGFAELLAEKKKNLLLMANSSCPPLLGAVTGETEEERNACASRIDELITTLVEKNEIKTVIISTRAAVYMSGDGFGEAEKNIRNMPIRAFSQNTSETKPETIFRNALQRTVDVLSRSGKTVYYLLENPEIGVDPSGCLSRPFRENKSLNCSVKVDVVLKRQAQYREIVKTISGATIIDLLAAFCANQACTAFADGKLLYADNNHLSVEGSRFVARKVLAPILFP